MVMSMELMSMDAWCLRFQGQEIAQVYAIVARGES